MVQPPVRAPSCQVGDTRHTAYSKPTLAIHDGFGHRAHPHRIRSPPSKRFALRRRLVAGAAHGKINSLLEPQSTPLSCPKQERAQSRVEYLAEIDKPD